MATELAILLKTPLTPEERKERDQLKAELKADMPVFTRIGAKLLIYRDKAYYREDYKSFEEFVDAEFALERAHAYRMMDAAKVESNLTVAIGDRLPMPSNERQFRALKSAPAEKQAEIWEAVVEEAGDKAPTSTLIDKIVNKFKKKKTVTFTPVVSGWTKEVLKADEELAEAFKKIERVYGKQDATAIQHGAIEDMKRADVLLLSKLTDDKMREIQNLVMANHWTPQRAMKFVNDMPTPDSTLEDMANWCLATKAGYFTATVDGFEYTVKTTRAWKRDRMD